MSKFVFVLALMGLTGCVIGPDPMPDDPNYAPVFVPTPHAASTSNGSLYSLDRALSLYEDNKARRVGDLLTVILEENTVSTKSTSIEVTKDSDISIPESANTGLFLGKNVTSGGLSLNTDLMGEREFTGEADADQRNNLRGNITVTVVDVWPNGTLAIRGEKWMTLNRGDEYIRITGLVRPSDIMSNNSVMSTKVGNARIAYAGKGSLADSQKIGWLGRFFNSEYWPF